MMSYSDEDFLSPADEHMQYEAGCYGNEFQAAFDLSRREREPDDERKIDDLVKAGRFVVYWSTEDFCRFTDASLGERRTYVADFATYAGALSEATDEDHRIAMPGTKTVPAPVAPTSEDEIPF